MMEGDTKAKRGVTAVALWLALTGGGCMGDGDCPVYEYAPASVQVSFQDATTGASICDARTAAEPGTLLPVQGACAYLLAGWPVDGDVELTVEGYATVRVRFEPQVDGCGNPAPPPPQEIAVVPEPE